MIAPRLVHWQRRHGRNDLPWQNTRDAYRVWLSEIMLQQTRVSSVIPYFLRFVERFPTIHALAAADEDEVLSLWSGLGYYTRARNLHRCARELVAQRGGVFPSDPSELERLPGIGRSTAAAIAVFAFGRRAAILDGNVRRVLARWEGIAGHAAEPAVLAALWNAAERHLPHDELQAYTQGLMDLGASLCSRTRPGCDRCPLADDCVARREGLVAAIPRPRPSRVLPVREQAWLVIRRDDEVLVEKRAPAGVWGGLWSLPEAEAHEAVEAPALALRRFALRTRAGAELAAVDHVFTHFRLRARPIVLVCESSGAGGVADETARWLALAQADAAPLPAPVKVLLRALGSSERTDASQNGPAGFEHGFHST
ncbi:MAG: A/G-specific adenine glycosylase [Burkholderiaceae bacterium]|nr:A/G-specific adenine glycosylase [Burkholderiaceae bacterium]